MDELFQKTTDDVLLVFDTILSNVATWDDVAVSATKNCVVFVRNKTFLVMKPMTKCLEIKFYSDEPFEDEDLHKSSQWNSKFEGVLRLSFEDQIKPHYYDYFKASYVIS